MNKKLKFPPKPNGIVALCIISESEIQKILPDYYYKFEEDFPTNFKLMMYNLGADINKHYFRQDGIQHRNRFNEVVVCSRWVFEERLDEAWINSGYASREAIDKVSGSKLIEDAYRARWLTEDAQAALESRDKYSKVEE